MLEHLARHFDRGWLALEDSQTGHSLGVGRRCERAPDVLVGDWAAGPSVPLVEWSERIRAFVQV